MKLCRFNNDRLGVVEGENIFDVTSALQGMPAVTWPVPLGDPLIANLATLAPIIAAKRSKAKAVPIESVSLHSPINNPSKVMAAPANYRAHVELDTKDAGVDQGVHRKALEGVERPAEKFGLFLKATSSVVGQAEGIQIILPDRRTDHEVELGVVIGKVARAVKKEQAMSYVAGYTLGLDMTVRGTEDRSFRKSPDTYTVLGPCFVTADEISDPHDLLMSLWINGELRQHSSTRAMTVDIPDLIVLASAMYTLHPGDVILTGTPEGVGPVLPGDIMRVSCDRVGEMMINIRAFS